MGCNEAAADDALSNEAAAPSSDAMELLCNHFPELEDSLSFMEGGSCWARLMIELSRVSCCLLYVVHLLNKSKARSMFSYHFISVLIGVEPGVIA